MEFDRSFFEDEVREGFFVSSAIKRSWAAQLEVLEEVATVCQKHSIEWFLDFGSLLGAIRHGGFIPWDDDLDITMTRPNYEKFLEVAHSELPSYYSILNVRFVPEYNEMSTRVSSGRGIDFSQWRLDKYHGSPLADGVDIFVLDYIPRDPELAALQQKMGLMVEDLYDKLSSSKYSIEELSPLISEVQDITGVTFDERPLLQQLYLLLDNIYRLFSYDDSDSIAHMYKHFQYEGHGHKYPKELFDNIIWVPFEHLELPVPIGYNKIIEIEYGDYMKLHKGGAKHDYPLYSAQEEFMLSRYPYKRIDYTFNKQDLLRPKPVADNDSANKHFDALLILSHYKHWHVLAPIYNKLISEGKTVTIILTSYYLKDVNNNLGDMYLDDELMPQEIEYILGNNFRFEGNIYTDIYTTDGIDECGRNYAVDRQFQVRELLKHSPNVTYVSPYIIDDFDSNNKVSGYSLRFLAGIPGVVRADHTIVNSDCIRDRYIEYLTNISGKKYEQVWKDKIISNP